MDQRNWQADWIWGKDGRNVNAHILFRKDFELVDVPDDCCLHIAAETYAKVWLNNKFIHQTTSISYPSRHYYEEIDISGALRKGKNQISILGRYVGIPSGDSCPKDPGLIAEITAGKDVLLATDDTWRLLQLDAWGRGDRRSFWFNLALMEVCDFRKLPHAWPTAEITDDWEVPESAPYPGVRIPHLERRAFSLLKIESNHNLKLYSSGYVKDKSANFAIPALAVSEEDIVLADFDILNYSKFNIPAPVRGDAVSLIFKFDAYDRGYPEIEIQGEVGGVLDISWHEHLTDGHCDFRKTKVYTTDRFILSEGLNVIRPWEWYCGHYLQLTFRDFSKNIKIEKLNWQSVNYPLTEQIKFSSSDAKLEQIWKISENSVRLCMQDNIMDCPWRERRQWIGDVHRIALINYYLFGDRNLVRAVLKQHVQLQDPSGRMWVCLPLFEEYPLQSMSWLSAVLDYELYTKDKSLLDEVFDNIVNLYHWFNRNRDKNGLLFITEPPVMNWQDNTFKSLMQYQFKTPFLVMNLRYIIFLRELEQIFFSRSRISEGNAIQQQRKDLTAMITGLFTDKETNLLRDMLDPELPLSFSEAGHALAVIAELSDAMVLWDRFCEYRNSTSNNIVKTTPFGKFWTFEALGILKREEQIIKEIINNWGPMVDAGSDTAWEVFADPACKSVSGHSLCHGWAGIPIVAIMRYIFKLEPDVLTNRRQENVGGIDWLEIQASETTLP